MAANQFQTFGLAGGAYVLSPSAYAAASWRPTGRGPGLVPKEAFNTPLRQVSFVGATLAQFMADQSGLDVNDDGNQSAFTATYKIAQRNFDASQRLTTETGSVNAYVIALSPAVTANVHGMEAVFKATHTNTGAATLNVGAGASPLCRIDGSALLEQDVLVGSTVSAIYNGIDDKWVITSVLINQLNRTAAWRYITAPTQLTVGSPYAVNTVAGSFDVTLPANPITGDALTFIDTSNYWGINTFTILRNGHTIMGFAEDLIVNLSDQMFSMWFNGTDWRLI